MKKQRDISLWPHRMAESPQYLAFVDWIAHNDEPGETDHATIAGSLTVTMVAHVFNLCADTIANDVIVARAGGGD